MKQSAFIYGFFGLVIGLVIGFWIANFYTRNLPAPLPAQNPISVQANREPEKTGEKLSREEILASFAAAENRKEDSDFQKKLGLALAGYSTVQNDRSFLPELIALLERANRLADEKDVEILTALADLYFIQGGEKSDPAFYDKARNVYQRAIILNPGNADLKAAHAATFLYSKPPRADAALAELNSILKQNQNHEFSLQLLILALIQTNQIQTAGQKLAELKKLNAANPAIPDLEAQLSQNKINSNR